MIIFMIMYESSLLNFGFLFMDLIPILSYSCFRSELCVLLLSDFVRLLLPIVSSLSIWTCFCSAPIFC
jgi:hypothetical protein